MSSAIHDTAGQIGFDALLAGADAENRRRRFEWESVVLFFNPPRFVAKTLAAWGHRMPQSISALISASNSNPFSL